MSHLIFLGAGASAAEGAPIQSQLITNMLKREWEADDRFPVHNPSSTVSLPSISSFFSYLFGVEKNDKNKPLPTFEEALGILDSAIAKGEGLGSYMYPSGSRVSGTGSLEQVRQKLIDALAQEVANSGTRGVHKKLCRNLLTDGLMKDVVFVTTNYDCYIDDALVELYQVENISCGCTFDDATQSAASPITLLKLHGSLQWQHCDNCGFTGNRPPKFNDNCTVCGGHNFLYPLIVPPTYMKRMGYDVIAQTWATFRHHLRKVKSITFCGYSFPDADFHVKAELKRAENISRPKLLERPSLKIAICNNYTGKTEQAKKYESDAYSRFFACDVNYTQLSFEEFSNDPSQLLAK